MNLMVTIAAAVATQALVAEPRGLSLDEAQTLPAPTLLERVLGAVGALYTEIQRPSPAITRGGGFAVAFASTPRSAGFPGLCEADTITVSFGPSADAPATSIAHVQYVDRGTVYRIVSDTAPLADMWNDSYGHMLAAQCAAAGPVLSRPGMAASRFFSGVYNASSDFWAAHAYFGARALVKAREAAAAGLLVECEDDRATAGKSFCDGAIGLLRSPPMDRFLGFQIERCAPQTPDLCVTANFARNSDIDGRRIAIRMRTSLSEVIGPPPNDFAVRGIHIGGYTAVP